MMPIALVALGHQRYQSSADVKLDANASKLRVAGDGHVQRLATDRRRHAHDAPQRWDAQISPQMPFTNVRRFQQVQRDRQHRRHRKPVHAAHPGPNRRRDHGSQRTPSMRHAHAKHHHQNTHLKVVVHSSLKEEKKEPSADERCSDPTADAQPTNHRPSRERGEPYPEQHLPQARCPQGDRARRNGIDCKQVPGAMHHRERHEFTVEGLGEDQRAVVVAACLRPPDRKRISTDCLFPM